MIYDGPLTVVVFCFNRPHYLKRVIDSMEKQTWLEDTRIYFHHDGAVNKFTKRHAAKQSVIEATRNLSSNCKVPKCVGVYSKENMGVAIQQFNAYEYHAKVDHRWVLYLDDDVLLSPYFFRVARLLIPLMEADEDVFTASPMFTKNEKMSKADMEKNLDLVEVGHHPWIGYVADMTRWARVRVPFMGYYEIGGHSDYSRRPGQRLIQQHLKNGSKKKATSQDSWKDVSMEVSGTKKLRCLVNRGLYIGEQGIHGNIGQYKQMGWAKHKPWVHPTDAERTELRMV